MNTTSAIFVWLSIISFFIAMLLGFLLRFNVDKEKLEKYSMTSKLWKTPHPPKEVLNEKGRKIHLSMGIFFVLFAIFVLIAIIIEKI